MQQFPEDAGLRSHLTEGLPKASSVLWRGCTLESPLLRRGEFHLLLTLSLPLVRAVDKVEECVLWAFRLP